jgi:REP element-mobilizing transposase RayT
VAKTRGRTTIGVHLILTGYGHWLSNDIRGSNSSEIRHPKFVPLGPIHHGRKPLQPSRQELREFMQQAEPLLLHPRIWFDERARAAIGAAFGQAIRERGYTCWACGVCSNHAHLVVRAHHDHSDVMWNAFADASREALRHAGLIPPNHPLWADNPYRELIYTPAYARNRAEYAEKNPPKEGLPRQFWPFVIPYDGWPFHKKQRP